MRYIKSVCKTYDHQIWKTGTTRGNDSDETNQAGTGNVSASKPCDKLKIYLQDQTKCLWLPNLAG